MLKVVLTSFFFIILAELAMQTVSLFGQLVFVLILYLEPTVETAEWLWRWIPDQTFVGSSLLTDDLFFCARYFVL